MARKIASRASSRSLTWLPFSRRPAHRSFSMACWRAGQVTSYARKTAYTSTLIQVPWSTAIAGRIRRRYFLPEWFSILLSSLIGILLDATGPDARAAPQRTGHGEALAEAVPLVDRS